MDWPNVLLSAEDALALRRAAQDAWGIGRYIYNKGIPGFIDPNNLALERPNTPIVGKSPVPELPASVLNNVLQDPPLPIVTTEQAMVIAKTAAAGAILDHQRTEMKKLQPVTMTRKDLDRSLGLPDEQPVLANLSKASNNAEPKPKAAKINLPRNGKSVFAWVKLLENTFGEKLMPLMTAKAKELEFSSTVAEWDEARTRTIALFAAGHCMKSSAYRGQFDHLRNEIAADSSRFDTTSLPKTTGINVADLRKELVNKMKALIAKQTGRDSTSEELKSMCEDIAPLCQTAQGHTGEIPESLNHLADATWISNMIRFVNDQIVHAMSNQVAPEADDTPF